MLKKFFDFLKRLFLIIKIAKKPDFSEMKKIMKFILFLTIFIGSLGFFFYVIGLLLI